MSKCYVYIIRSGRGNRRPIKIGMADNPKRRIKELQTGNPELLNLVLTMKCNSRKHARLVERTLHNQLEGVNILGEWYQVKENKLFKVLKLLAKDPSCDVIEEFNLTAPVEHTRQMLRTERKRSDSLRRHTKEMEEEIAKRKKKCKVYRELLNNLGMTDKEIQDELKKGGL